MRLPRHEFHGHLLLNMRRIVALPLALLPLVVIAGCGGGTASFTDAQNVKVQSNFVLSCANQSGATVDACMRAYTCISGGGSKGIAYKDFALADLQLRLGQQVDPKVLDKITACESA
jgi:hypothetical protein